MANREYLQRAIWLGLNNTHKHQGQPFGAVIVKDGEVIATGVNEIAKNNDPTAHAEIQAIRAACQKLESALLTDCVLYASSQPCPLCMEAIGWADLKAVYYAATFEEAGKVGFAPTADWNGLTERVDMNTAQIEPFKVWSDKDKN